MFLNARGLLIFLLVILPLFCAVSCIVQVKTITRFYISERVDDTISFVLSVLSLLVAIGFLYYGLKLYFVLRRYRLLSTRKASQTRKVPRFSLFGTNLKLGCWSRCNGFCLLCRKSFLIHLVCSSILATSSTTIQCVLGSLSRVLLFIGNRSG